MENSLDVKKPTEIRELLDAMAFYVHVVNEHAEALADYAEDMDGDAEQIVSSLGFIGRLHPGCLDPEEDDLAAAMSVLRSALTKTAQS